jgi:hypothetical protein
MRYPVPPEKDSLGDMSVRFSDLATESLIEQKRRVKIKACTYSFFAFHALADLFF